VCTHTLGEVDNFMPHYSALIANAMYQMWWKSINNF